LKPSNLVSGSIVELGPSRLFGRRSVDRNYSQLQPDTRQGRPASPELAQPSNRSNSYPISSPQHSHDLPFKNLLSDSSAFLLVPICFSPRPSFDTFCLPKIHPRAYILLSFYSTLSSEPEVPANDLDHRQYCRDYELYVLVMETTLDQVLDKVELTNLSHPSPLQPPRPEPQHLPWLDKLFINAHRLRFCIS
jgi:hypothetical protein